MPSTDRRILLVNPNTNTTTTAMMTQLAQNQLERAAIAVHGATALRGPSMIEELGVAIWPQRGAPNGRRSSGRKAACRRRSARSYWHQGWFWYAQEAQKSVDYG